MTSKEAKSILDYIFKKSHCRFSKFVGGTMFVNAFHSGMETPRCPYDLVVGSCVHHNDFRAINAGIDLDAKYSNVVHEMLSRSLAGEMIVARNERDECILLQPFTSYEKIAIEAELDTN